RPGRLLPLSQILAAVHHGFAVESGIGGGDGAEDELIRPRPGRQRHVWAERHHGVLSQRPVVSGGASVQPIPSGCRHLAGRPGAGEVASSGPWPRLPPTPHLPWPTRWTETSGARSRRRSSWAFKATTIVDSDMRIAPTLIGRTKPIGARTPAARGTDSRLYPAAHHRFCFIFRYVARESSTIDRTDRGSSEARMTPAEPMATSVPAPMAMPTSACASAGASLTPSPTIATRLPSFCSSLTFADLSAGWTPAKTRSMPSSAATDRATASASPVIMTTCV